MDTGGGILIDIITVIESEGAGGLGGLIHTTHWHQMSFDSSVVLMPKGS